MLKSFSPVAIFSDMDCHSKLKFQKLSENSICLFAFSKKAVECHHHVYKYQGLYIRRTDFS